MSLDEQIQQYSNSSFDAEHCARRFFSEHSDSEVHHKLNELANLQNQIESNLRHKVRDNYSLFMFANDEINRVGEEMSELKHLLNSTKKMLDELQSLRPVMEGNNDIRHALNLPLFRQDSGQRGRSSTDCAVDNSANPSSIPAWVTNTPRDVEKYVVEQQYSKAVTLIGRSLAYMDSVRVVGVSDNAARNISDSIQNKRVMLAQTLRDSLTKLPSSELFGGAEQTKRLKLLITLGHSALAAEGFAAGRKDVIRKALRFVEASGDPAAFTAELSRVFFVNLRDACKSFMDLFAKSTPDLNLPSSAISLQNASMTKPKETDVASLSYLVGWLQDQMTVFVTALSRQIQVGAAEYAAEVFQLPLSVLLTHCAMGGAKHDSDTFVGGAPLTLSPSSSLKRATSFFHTAIPSPGDSCSGTRVMKRVSSASRASVMRTNSARSNTASINTSSAKCALGPLTFTSHCLQVAFREAVVLDQLGLQGASSLSWNLMPEIKTIVNSFADDIIKDIESKVLNDDWIKTACKNSEISLPNRMITQKRDTSNPSSKEKTKKKTGLLSLFGGVSSIEDDEDNMDVVENTLGGEISIDTAVSYQWVVVLITYFISEVYALLQVQASSPPADDVPNSKRKKSDSGILNEGNYFCGEANCVYARVDLCEVEPEAVACILRILIRYVRAIISLDINSLSYSQRECYFGTVEEIKVSLLPSAEDAILKGFFSDGSTLIANPPKAVFKHLRTNLEVASYVEIKD